MHFSDLPMLPTMGIGSYAAPGWYIAARELIANGRFGSGDIEEALADATRVVVADQSDAGVDVFSDGELRRQRFVYEMYQHLEGIVRVPSARKLGISGYDMAPHFVAGESVTAPRGFGLVDDFRFVRTLLPSAPIKMALPGPLTFGGSIEAGKRDPAVVLDEIIVAIRTEIEALVSAGVTYLQLDEPLLPHPPYGLSLDDAAEAINRCIRDLPILTAVHVCFGNNAGRPFADRRMGRLVPGVMKLECDQLLLEFANREFADVELLKELSARFHIAAGVIDVKNFHEESPHLVAERIERCLRHVCAHRLAVTADCGFSALPRHLAKSKLCAMVAGTQLVRDRLGQ